MEKQPTNLISMEENFSSKCNHESTDGTLLKKRPYLVTFSEPENHPMKQVEEDEPVLIFGKVVGMTKKILPLNPEIPQNPVQQEAINQQCPIPLISENPIQNKTQNPEILKPITGSNNSCSVLPPKKRLCLSLQLEANPQKEQDSATSITALFDYIREKTKTDITDQKLVMERSLQTTDVQPQQSRFAIPRGQIKIPFLTQSEEDRLRRKDNFKVKVFGSLSPQEYQLDIARWNYAGGVKRGWKYVLNSGWNNFMTENSLKERQYIELWSFRQEGRLCFAILGLQKYNIEGKSRSRKIKNVSASLAVDVTKKKKGPRTRRVVDGKSNMKNMTPLSVSLADLSWGKTCLRTPRLPVSLADDLTWKNTRPRTSRPAVS